MLRILVLFLLWGPAAYAATQVRLTRPVTVYARPDLEATVAFSLRAGALITVADREVRGFRKIRVMSRGRKRFGYILSADLEVQKNLGRRGPWGLGGGLLYSRLSQDSKSFSTSDEVTYTTSDYVSQSFNLFAFYEFGGKNFWRLYGGLRSVDFDSRATLNVQGASAQAIEVGYRFIALGGQKAWLIFNDRFYAGAGLEFAKSISAKAKIGNQDLSDKVEGPDYIIGFGMIGAQYQIYDKWSLFAEVRVGAAANQSPTITVVELVSSVLYWPK